MKQPSITNWQPDATQQQIIDILGGTHLVLAPPGCGKTQILAERIRRAHEQGVSYADMLCLTFTNRAARGMRERINSNIDDRSTADVFVGNVHRYCSRFLFDNHIVPAESAIIDDDTVVSILAMYLNETEEAVLSNNQRRRYYSEIMFFSHLMYEVAHNIPKSLRLHPECVTSADVAVMRAICQVQNRSFTAEAMTDIYDHTDFYLDLVRSQAFEPSLRQWGERTLTKMRFAHGYTAYKQQNNLLDFEDLLLLTYTALTAGKSYRRYPWIQVDEVQDLNLLQLAIIDRLSGHNETLSVAQRDQREATMMYLGDEQQAIFSFMGAKLSTLEALKERCKGHIHHLGVNHRSPGYLVELFNTYAIHELGSDPDLLPTPGNDRQAEGRELQLVSSESLEEEFTDVARLAATLSESHPEETTAVVVSSNRDADDVSSVLSNLGKSHFKVSGQDVFATVEVKLLLAHLSVLANEHNFLAWSRLMRGLMVCETNASARQFVHRLETCALTPSDFLVGDGKPYVQRFLDIYDQRDLVVFDTETTGLDVFEDDIIQIAAERIRQGQTVDRFVVHIQTDREIPLMLGDVPNPIIEERRHQPLRGHAEALRMFLDFVGNDILLGHNASYDYRIMMHNLRRYVPEVDWEQEHPLCLDSLKLIRLLRPDLKAYKLAYLLGEIGLAGENSHLADDDVHATVQLVNYCYTRGQDVRPAQQELLGRKGVKIQVERLVSHYRELYVAGCERLDLRLPATQEPAVVSEMRRIYEILRANGWMGELPKLDYILRFLRDDVIRVDTEPSLREQLDRHIIEMNTFKEADLCGASTIEDRIFVTTIHKAKGLEFDNVIVFDVVDGRLPNYYSEGNPAQLSEDARKLYVAMTRAKKRLFISYSRQKQVGRDTKPQRLSRFMEHVRHLFVE